MLKSPKNPNSRKSYYYIDTKTFLSIHNLVLPTFSYISTLWSSSIRPVRSVDFVSVSHRHFLLHTFPLTPETPRSLFSLLLSLFVSSLHLTLNKQNLLNRISYGCFINILFIKYLVHLFILPGFFFFLLLTRKEGSFFIYFFCFITKINKIINK